MSLRLTENNRITPVILTAVMTLLMIGALRWEGRIWWCAQGDLNPVTLDAWGAHNSQHFLDPYSVTHLLHGVVFWWLLMPVATRVSTSWRLLAGLSLEALWEVLENSAWVIDRYRTATAARGYTGDSVLNSLGDLVACGAGLLVARRLGWRRSLILFVAAELLVLCWIRDSLTLNVIMLICPLDAIRDWQLRT